MNLFSKSSQLFLFLVLIVCQNVFAASLTKAEAENGRLMNGTIGRILAHLQRDPKPAELLLKSATAMIKSLEELGTKDPNSSFAQDAQKWEKAIGEFAGWGLKDTSEEQPIDVEKIAAAKREVMRALAEIAHHKLERFITKEQKEFIEKSAEKVIKAAEVELKLLAGDKLRLKGRAGEIKEAYENAIAEYKKNNQQVQKKQIGFAVDVLQEVASFNKRIDTVVKNVIREQREFKKDQPGGLSLEDRLEEFDEFIADQIKVGKRRRRVESVRMSAEEKGVVDNQLFDLVLPLLSSLKELPVEEKDAIIAHIKTNSEKMIDEQFEQNAGILGFFATTEDKERKELFNQQFEREIEKVFPSAQASAEGEEAEVVEGQAEEPVGQQKEEQEEHILLTPPNRPKSSEGRPVERPSTLAQPIQPKEEVQQQGQAQSVQQAPVGQQEQLQQEFSKEEQFEQMKNEFTETMTALSTSGTVEGWEEDSKHGQKAKEIIKFLVENPTVGNLEETALWAKKLYSDAITKQNENLGALRKRQDSDLAVSKQRFAKPIDEYIATIKK
jgi:hypothetical protein